MRVDVVFGALALTAGETHGRVVAVVDVLRASTTVAVALANGAKNIIPFETTEEAALRSKAFERRDVRLAGERRMLPVPGFDLGNSPREFTRDVVEGKTILFTTTNGTGALVAVQGARDVVIASYVNYSAVLAMLRAAVRGGTDVTILCAGRERQFAIEDAACAGRFVRGIVRRLAAVTVNDAANAALLLERRYGDALDRLFMEAEHGRALVAAGFAEDLAACAQIDAFPVVPIYSDRQITMLGPSRER